MQGDGCLDGEVGAGWRSAEVMVEVGEGWMLVDTGGPRAASEPGGGRGEEVVTSSSLPSSIVRRKSWLMFGLRQYTTCES